MQAPWCPWLPSSPSLETLREIHDTASAFIRASFDRESLSNEERIWADKSIKCLDGLHGELSELCEPSVALLGHDSAGKSTLLNALLGVANLLPAQSGGAAVTQNVTDVLVDPSLTEYHVKVQFSQQYGPPGSSWEDRRRKWATALLDEMDARTLAEAEYTIEQRSNTAPIRILLGHLYGASKINNRAFLERLCECPANEDPNPSINAALCEPLGIRHVVAHSLEELRSVLHPLLSVPKDTLSENEASKYLYAIADRVWIAGPFPNALIPSGVHVLDTPGMNDIGEHRRAIAWKNAQVLLLCISSRDSRWLNDSWAAEQRHEARLQQKKCIMILTKADKAFKDDTILATDLRGAASHFDDRVQVVHTSAKYALSLSMPPHATRFGLLTIAKILEDEKERVQALMLAAQTRLCKALQECHEYLWQSMEVAEDYLASAAQLEARLFDAAQVGLNAASKAIEEAEAELAQTSPSIVHNWSNELRACTNSLTRSTLLCTLRFGGTFRSSGKAGLVDLPARMLDVLMNNCNLEHIWQRLFEKLQEAVRLCQEEIQLVLQGVSSNRASALHPLESTLNALLSRRRREFSPTLRASLVNVLAPALRPTSGTGSRAVMLATLYTYIDRNCAAMLKEVLQASSVYLAETLNLMRNEVRRTTSSVAVALGTPMQRIHAHNGCLSPQMKELNDRWQRLLGEPPVVTPANPRTTSPPAAKHSPFAAPIFPSVVSTSSSSSSSSALPKTVGNTTTPSSLSPCTFNLASSPASPAVSSESPFAAPIFGSPVASTTTASSTPSTLPAFPFSGSLESSSSPASFSPAFNSSFATDAPSMPPPATPTSQFGFSSTSPSASSPSFGSFNSFHLPSSAPFSPFSSPSAPPSDATAAAPRRILKARRRPK